jgi:lipopolysaccharide transport system ATP-binding protein
LLEVGTGFHPELTGRENIYLNGSILGMKRAEIRRKFDEIVAFAEVEQFLDTPVKRYSSGMYVRLAFAVAAHLEAEILAVDEVLAVGDAAFQKKCLGKMSEVAQAGRTLLFVSHNMNAIERLCRRVMVLADKRVIGTYDDAREGIHAYLTGADGASRSTLWENQGGKCKNDYFIPGKLEIHSTAIDTRPDEPFSNRFAIEISVEGLVERVDTALNIGVAVYDERGELLFWSFTTDAQQDEWPRLNTGAITLRVRIPPRLLNEGNYRVELLASLHHRAWLLQPNGSVPSLRFSIRGGLSDSPLWDHVRPGVFAPVLRWVND